MAAAPCKRCNHRKYKHYGPGGEDGCEAISCRCGGYKEGKKVAPAPPVTRRPRHRRVVGQGVPPPPKPPVSALAKLGPGPYT